MGFLARNKLLLAILLLISASCCPAQTRTAQDMVKECRVALDVFEGRAERNYTNTFYAAQCVGYLQGVSDVSVVLADHLKGLKSCIPDHTSTIDLIQKFIAFADGNPKYTLASTAFQTMLSQEYPCRK